MTFKDEMSIFERCQASFKEGVPCFPKMPKDELALFLILGPSSSLHRNTPGVISSVNGFILTRGI